MDLGPSESTDDEQQTVAGYMSHMSLEKDEATELCYTNNMYMQLIKLSVVRRY